VVQAARAFSAGAHADASSEAPCVMEVSIDSLDGESCKDDLLLSVRCGAVRRQVAASKAVQQPLVIAELPERTTASTPNVKIDLLARVSSTYVLLRPDCESYTATLKSAASAQDSAEPASKPLTVRVALKRTAGVDRPVTGTKSLPHLPHLPASGGAEGGEEPLHHHHHHHQQHNAAKAVDMLKADSIEKGSKEYLEAHGLLTFFHALLHALMRQKPASPYAFLASQLPQKAEERPKSRGSSTATGPTRREKKAVSKDGEPGGKQCAFARQNSGGGFSRQNSPGSKKGEFLRQNSGGSEASQSGHARGPMEEENRRLKKENGTLRLQVEDLRREIEQLTAKAETATAALANSQAMGLQLSLNPRASRSTGNLALMGQSWPGRRELRELVLHGSRSPGSWNHRGQRVAPPPQEGSASPTHDSSGSLSFNQRGSLLASDKRIEQGLDNFWKRLRGQSDPGDEFRVLRQSVFTGRWTLYQAGGKASKPTQYTSSRRTPRVTEMPLHESRCPFCVGNEHKTPDPLLFFDGNCQPCTGADLSEDWLVRVIPNIFPLFVTPKGLYTESFHEKLKAIPHSAVVRGEHKNEVLCVGAANLQDPVCEDETSDLATQRQVTAVGYSEVVIEHRDHNGLLAISNSKQISLGLRALQHRGKELSRQQGVRQLLYFKQYGALSGGSLVHPHMQIVTLPLLTPEMQNRLSRAVDYHEQCGQCAVCQAHLQETSIEGGTASSRLVYETEHFLVVVPFASNQYRVTIVPRVHNPSWLTISVAEVEDLAFVLQLVMEAIFHLLDDPEYNIYFFSVDCEGELANGEDEAVHWVLEVHPRFPAELGGIELASGIRVISGLPEDWAQRLKRGIKERLAAR